MKLYGSQTSPYVRLCRVVAAAKGTPLELVRTDPFADEAFRAVNPLGKVPALIAPDGTALTDSGVIVRFLDAGSGPSLYETEGLPRHAADAAASLATGILDLGVAYLLEHRRPETERSASWQARRMDGIEAALPMLAARARTLGPATGIVRLGAACALDWLSFRLPQVAWRAHEALGALADEQLASPAFAGTDPRDG